jgi:hypothetical protein
MIQGTLGENHAASAGVRDNKSFPNGDFRRLRVGATNEVIASSRDQVHLRVENTKEVPATATRGFDSLY